jgi:ubiquinone biosynthesis protein Coq4
LLKDPDQLAALLRGISLGYRLGLAAKPFLAQKWEERWTDSLAGCRQELNVDAAAADPLALEQLTRNRAAES